MISTVASRLKNELVLICIASLALDAAIAFCPYDLPRIVLGLPFVFFFPGYTLTAALFPRRQSLSGFERISFAVILSIVINILIGFILNYTWSISLFPMLLVTNVLIIIASVYALVQRAGLPEADRPFFTFRLRLPAWSMQGPLDKSLAVLLAVAVVGGAGASGYAAIKNRQDYSEFYILGAADKMENYPYLLSAGKQGTVTLVIENHEHRKAGYRVETLVNGSQQSEVSANLTDGEKWQQPVSFSFPAAGNDQKVEFAFYRDGKAYQQPLRLWVNVK